MSDANRNENMKTAAEVKIIRAADMSYKGRMKIARWIHRQARLLEDKNTAAKLADKYVAKWEYDDRK